MSQRRLSTVWMVATLVTFWGISWPVYKVGVHYTPPLLFAGVRTFLGGIVLILLSILGRRSFRWRSAWPVYLVSTLFNSVLFFGIQTVAIACLPSGLSSVVVYLEPVLVGLFAWLWLGEALTARKILGLVLGFLGVVSVSADSLTGQVSFTGILFGLAAAVAWAIGTVYLKREQHRVDLLCLVAVQCLIGGAVLMAVGSVIESWRAVQWTQPGYIAGVLFGALIGTSSSWLIWFQLVRAGEVSRVSAYTFFVPLISVVIGTVALGEPFTPFLLVGMCLIAASIYLVNRVPGPVPLSGRWHSG